MGYPLVTSRYIAWLSRFGDGGQRCGYTYGYSSRGRHHESRPGFINETPRVITIGESEHDGMSLEERIFWLEQNLGIARTPEQIAELDRRIAEEDAAAIVAES